LEIIGTLVLDLPMEKLVTNPNDKELGALREKAELVKRKLVATPRERALFVEFSGSPKSGKSTCIDIVAHFLRRLGFSTLAPTEGASKRTPYYLKRDLVAFNVWSATYAFNAYFGRPLIF
jgi:pantothenate kinase